MPMVRYGKPTGRQVSRGMLSNTPYVVIRGPIPNNDLPAVILLHGFTGETTADQLLDNTATTIMGATGIGAGAYPLDAILATGRTVIAPFTGNNWGLPSVGSNPGTNTIDTMMTVASSLGITNDKIDIIGGSMGACNAINWANENAGMVNKVIIYVPLVSLGAAYDLGGAVRDSIDAAYGTSNNKPAFMSACEYYDPIRMDLSDLDGKVLAVAASNDPVVPYPDVIDLCSVNGFPLITTTSGHLSLDDDNFNEIEVLNHLDS